MSWFHVRRSQSGFTFENRISSLLAGLSYNIKFPNVEFTCVDQNHLQSSHELDHWVEFLSGRKQELPTFAEDVMVVSCNKSFTNENDVKHEKIELLESMSCFSSFSSISPAGLIVTSSNIPDCNSNMGDRIFFWDIRRCFFYAWKSFYANNSKWKFNSWEKRLPRHSSYFFGTEEPIDLETKFAYCEIFYDNNPPLDQQTLEQFLSKIRGYANTLKSDQITISIYIHTINGYVNQIENDKITIQNNASTANIKFELKNFYDYSIVPWEPITKVRT